MPACSECEEDLAKTKFSKNQLRKDPSSRKCKDCIQGAVASTSTVTHTPVPKSSDATPPAEDVNASAPDPDPVPTPTPDPTPSAEEEVVAVVPLVEETELDKDASSSPEREIPQNLGTSKSDETKAIDPVVTASTSESSKTAAEESNGDVIQQQSEKAAENAENTVEDYPAAGAANALEADANAGEDYGNIKGADTPVLTPKVIHVSDVANDVSGTIDVEHTSELDTDVANASPTPNASAFDPIQQDSEYLVKIFEDAEETEKSPVIVDTNNVNMNDLGAEQEQVVKVDTEMIQPLRVQEVTCKETESVGDLSAKTSSNRIRVGICAMDKKARSKPMVSYDLCMHLQNQSLVSGASTSIMILSLCCTHRYRVKS